MQPATADMTESSPHCIVLEVPFNRKVDGDGSGVKSKYILVCEKVKKTQ